MTEIKHENVASRLVERFLNLHAGDLGRGALLFGYLFLVIASYVGGKVARDALFLDRFRAVQLPFADVAVAVLVGFIVAGYVRLGRRTNLRNLLVASLLVFAASAVVFGWLASTYRLPWLYPIIYVWVGIVGVLAPAQVWTLANYVLTTREAKRLFGLVGSGAILGWIFGGFYAKASVRAFGTESLLYGMAAFLAACAVLVALIWRRREAVTPGSGDATGMGGTERPDDFLESLRLVVSSRYLRSIATVICLSSFATTTAGWQFKAIAEQFLVRKDAMAAFFADFNFYAGLLSLVTQLLLTSRILRRYGIGPGLLVVPSALLLGSVGLLALPVLLMAGILKGCDQVLRYSIDKSTVELLYLPLPARIKLQVKSFIDTVVWRLGDGLAGINLLVFATGLGLTVRQVTWLNLVAIAGWLRAALVARREYVVGLRESVREHRLDAERAMAPVLDRSTAEVFAANLETSDPKDILYALGLFEVSHGAAVHPAVRGLLKHPAAEVRRTALALLASAGDGGALSEAEALVADADPAVRAEALGYVIRFAHRDPLALVKEIGEFPDASVRAGIVAFLARPSTRQDLDTARLVLEGMVGEKGSQGRAARLEAAKVLRVLPDVFENALATLVADEDDEIRLEAIRSAGQVRSRRVVPALVEGLGDPVTASAAGDALSRFGDRVVGTLRDHLSDPSTAPEIRKKAASVLGRIGTASAAQALVEELLESDSTLRFRILSALNKIRQQHPDVEIDPQLVETVLAAEILGHYRSYQILGTLGADIEGHGSMAEALRHSMGREIERIFRLLGLLFPNHDFHSAHVGLQSKSQVVHDNALELLDNVLKPQFRGLLVPLLDGDVPFEQRVRLAERVVGSSVEGPEEAVASLLLSSEPWLKSCGAYAVGTLGLRSLERELEACLDHPDPLLRETARQAKRRLARGTSSG